MRRWSRSKSESVPTRHAREGAQRAEAELVEVRKRREVVNLLAEAIDSAIRRNHFGESIERSLAVRRGR